MGLTGSNSGLFRALAFIVSPVGKRGEQKGKGKEGKRNREGKEGRKERRKERRKEGGREGRREGRKEEGIKRIGGKKRRRNFNKN